MDEEEILRAAKDAIELVQNIDREFRVAAFQTILQHLLAPMGRGEAVSVDAEVASFDLADLNDQFSPSTHRETVLMMAYHLQVIGDPLFNIKDLETLHSKLLIPKPQNLNAIVNSNRKLGLIMKADEPRGGMTAFRITRKGMEEVGEHLGKAAGAINPT